MAGLTVARPFSIRFGMGRIAMLKKSLLLCLLLTTSCVTTNVTMLEGNQALPPINPADVILYRTAATVPGAYKELALLNSTGDATYSDQPMMYQSMKQKAASIGANAVILDATTEPSAGARVAAAIFGVSASRTGKAVAIFIDTPEFRAQSNEKGKNRTRELMTDAYNKLGISKKKYPATWNIDAHARDAWGVPFHYERTADGSGYRLVSAGADRTFARETWSVEGEFENPAEDIVFLVHNGSARWFRAWKLSSGQ